MVDKRPFGITDSIITDRSVVEDGSIVGVFSENLVMGLVRLLVKRTIIFDFISNRKIFITN